jgi:hypothetical protein
MPSSGIPVVSAASLLAEPETLASAVAAHGVALVPGFLAGVALERTREAARAALDAVPRDGKYSAGHLVRLSSGEQKDHPGLRAAFAAPSLQHVMAKTFADPATPDDIFVFHEFIADGEPARNAFLHFDRYHALKFLCYLSDTDRAGGAIRFVVGSHVAMRSRRESEWRRTQVYADVRNRPLLDFPELGYAEGDATPVEAAAGGLVVFDTDTLHFGGIVESGRERLGIRLHCRTPALLSRMGRVKPTGLLGRALGWAKRRVTRPR